MFKPIKPIKFRKFKCPECDFEFSAEYVVKNQQKAEEKSHSDDFWSVQMDVQQP